MPYQWDQEITRPPAADAPGHAEGAAPIGRLSAWPYRSLPKQGFAAVIGLTFTLMLVPLSVAVGTKVLWVLLAFAMVTLWGLWALIQKSYRDGEILEELEIWPDHLRLTRIGPRRREQSWEANIHWVTLHRHDHGGPVAHYLTLKGAGREVEIGAFLHEDERPALHAELDRALTLAKSRSPG